MLSPEPRSAWSARLTNQLAQLETRSCAEGGVGDISVGDVFSPQIERSSQVIASQNGPPESGFILKSPNKCAEDGPPSRTGYNVADLNPPSNVPTLRQKTSRRKKRGKAGHVAAMDVDHVVPALSTVRGFTPVASGDEDSDRSVCASRNMSPRLKATGNSGLSNGISALKLQLDALNLSGNRPGSRSTMTGGSQTPSNASITSESDQTEVMMSYEVPLEHDFISQEAVANEETSLASWHKPPPGENICRKMTSEDFEPLMCLGKGTYGTVLLVRHIATGRLYAQKQFRKASLTVHKKLVEQTKTERMVLESVNRHPFVVKLYYAFQDHEKLYLILEYAQGGELFTHLAAEKMFSEEVASFYMAEMVLALEHLHQNIGVVYRDLKPENCLLDAEGHLLLTDFGLSKVAIDGDDRCNSSLGTIEYMAPEVVQGKPYGKACDWWSLGALGFDLLTGSPPFKANNHAKIQEKIVRQKLVLPYFLGPDAKDLLTRLLRKEPHKRLGYHMPKDLDTIKKHRFFRKINWKALERRELVAPIQPLITDPALAENFSDDFTTLPLSPVITKSLPQSGIWPQTMDVPGISDSSVANEADLFRGFSFVASSSLLNSGFEVTADGFY